MTERLRAIKVHSFEATSSPSFHSGACMLLVENKVNQSLKDKVICSQFLPLKFAAVSLLEEKKVLTQYKVKVPLVVSIGSSSCREYKRATLKLRPT